VKRIGFLSQKMVRQAVGERILKNFDFLKQLSRLKSEQKRNHLLKNATCDELLAIVEIATNILKGGFCLTKRQRNKLTPFAQYIRKIAKLRSERGARKYFNNQQGGQVGILSALLAPVLVEAAQHLISKISGDG
jgi:hypothetical protein